MSSKPVLTDARVKAAVGYVPYFGISIYPAFGRDQKGLDNVTLPFLAIAGTADTTAPIGPTRDGIHRLVNTHELVALQGVQHGFAAAFSDDIFHVVARVSRRINCRAILWRVPPVRG